MKTRVKNTLSAEQFQQIQNKIEDLKISFDFLEPVNIENKRKFQAITQRSVGFVRDTQKTSRKRSEIISPMINPENFEADFSYFEYLKIYAEEVGAIKQLLDDNVILQGQVVMKQANEVYNAVKRAAKYDKEYQPILDELSHFYKRTKAKKANSNPDTNIKNG